MILTEFYGYSEGIAIAQLLLTKSRATTVKLANFD